MYRKIRLHHVIMFFRRASIGRARFAPLTLLAVTAVTLGLIGFGATSITHTFRSQNEGEDQKTRGQVESVYDGVEQAPVAEASNTGQSVDQPPAPQPQPKYSTSSDPRSTAYSTTPPAPSPASLSITITHMGQLAAGDTMYYNATKGEKGYYGGDLVLSPASVTISRSGQKTAPITVSSPNGSPISMSSMPWNDQNPHFSIGISGSSVPEPALSHNMIVDTYNMPQVGTYQLHISSGCSGYAPNGCESHGFITVNVVD